MNQIGYRPPIPEFDRLNINQITDILKHLMILPKNDAAKPMLLPGKEKDLEEPRAPDPEWRQSVSPAYRSNIDLMIVFLTSSSGVK